LLKDVKLDSDEVPRPELALADFVLGDEALRLMTRLDQTGAGRIRRIEIRAGLARRALFEATLTGALR
jgi:hypothetical protein